MSNKDDKLKKVLTTEVKYLIGIALFVAGVLAPFYSVKQDVALIKQNHYSHIETMTEQIRNNSDDIKDVEERQTELMEIIITNQARLDSIIK